LTSSDVIALDLQEISTPNAPAKSHDNAAAALSQPARQGNTVTCRVGGRPISQTDTPADSEDMIFNI
jgi:hypothetical protein